MTADTIILYPKNGEQASGKLIVNDTYQIEYDTKDMEALPGASLIFSFEEMPVSSLKLIAAGEESLGEILVLGR